MSHWQSLDSYPAIRPSTPYHIVQRRRRVAKWWCAALAAVVILAVFKGVA